MRYLFCIFLCLMTACSTDTAQNNNVADYTITLNSELMTAYNNGDSILLFSYERESFHPETYADWAFYLNEFSHEQQDTFIIKQVKANTLTSSTSTEIVSKNFSVFLKKEMPSYLLSDPILEPQVYTSISKVYKQKTLTEADNAFLSLETNLNVKQQN